MNSPRSVRRCLYWLLLGCGWLLAVRGASAQQQDSKLFDRIMRPNMDMHAEGFGKAFEPAASGENRSFLTRLFGGSHAATTRGDGMFRSSSFSSGKGAFNSGSFATKKSPLAEQSASQYTRGFDTKPLATNEDRAAGKAASTQGYQPSSKVFIEKGKRQDDIDELRRQKNLTSDQVREILNRNK